VGETLVIAGATVKFEPLVATPFTFTTTLPVVAALGTGTTICVSLQLLGVAAVPLKVTVLVPWELPKVVPLMVTEVPTGPEVGERLVIAGRTVKFTPLLATPFTVTTTLPLVAPLGTGTTMLVMLQLVGVADTPLKVTVLAPRVAPKPDPLMVTDPPTAPAAGARLVIAGTTVYAKPLLATPTTVTTRGPLVAAAGIGTTILVLLQLVGVAAAPLNVTVLVPWAAPKPDPVIVTEPPTEPDVGETLLISGVTENVNPGPGCPPMVTTT
jgi:hypothetical protein